MALRVAHSADITSSQAAEGLAVVAGVGEAGKGKGMGVGVVATSSNTWALVVPGGRRHIERDLSLPAAQAHGALVRTLPALRYHMC